MNPPRNRVQPNIVAEQVHVICMRLAVWKNCFAQTMQLQRRKITYVNGKEYEDSMDTGNKLQ